MERLEKRVDHCSTRHCDLLAPEGISALLEIQIKKKKDWTTIH
jgi:hypothetical protein